MKSVFPGIELFENRSLGWLKALRESRRKRWVRPKRKGVREKRKPPPLTPEMAEKVKLLPEGMRKEMGLE